MAHSLLRDALESTGTRDRIDLSELLERGLFTVDLPAASLDDVVRRLQILTHVDVRITYGQTSDAAEITVPAFRRESRPLRVVLDDLLDLLPEGWTWQLVYGQIHVFRMRGTEVPRPAVVLRIHDVADLVMPGARKRTADTEAPEARGRPPAPAEYRADPNGGGPVRVR